MLTEMKKMLLKVIVSEASLEARTAELSPMRWPAILNHPSIAVPEGHRDALLYYSVTQT